MLKISQSLEQSGNNIALNTNTKHKILHKYAISADDGNCDPQKPLASSGLFGVPSGEVISSCVGNALLEKPNFQYLAVTVKDQTRETRLEVNLDFRLQNSQHFNKLVFNLVGWSRRREFFENIQDIADWSGYQQAYALQEKTGYIGKGRPRVRYQRGQIVNRSPIQEYTSMLVSMEDDQLKCNLWIENAHFEIPLERWSDQNNIFIARGEYIDNSNSGRRRGGWL